LGAGVREANADIQSGSYFGRINRPYATDRVLIHGVGSLSKGHALWLAFEKKPHLIGALIETSLNTVISSPPI
jgi:hypothetical protein